MEVAECSEWPPPTRPPPAALLPKSCAQAPALFADGPRSGGREEGERQPAPVREHGEDCRGSSKTSGQCEWLRQALLEERAALARDLLSKHTAMVAELEARLSAPAHGRRTAWPAEDARAPPPRGEPEQALAELEGGDGGRAPTGAPADGGPPAGGAHLRAAAEAWDGIARLESSREVTSSPSSPTSARGGTVRKPRSTFALSERGRSRRSEAADSRSGTVDWRRSVRATLPPTLHRTAQRLFHSRMSGLEDKWKFRQFAKSNTMEVISAVVIVVTTICAALEVQYHSFQLGHDLGYRWYHATSQDTWPGADVFFEVMDYVCGVAFTLEVLVKLSALRGGFFCDGWNLLDLSVTICWYMEILGDSIIPLDPTMLRMGRLVRLFRLLKLAKKIHGFDSLYLMTTAIRGSAASLGWSCCLLSLFQIVVALCVNSILSNFYLENPQYPQSERMKVFEYWGSFSRAVLTTFEITLADFPEPCRMLSEYVNEWFAVFFVAHKLTIGFAVIGVINGVFIQETFKVATTDDQLMIRQRERAMKTHAKKMDRLFEAADETGDGLLDLREFLATMKEPEVQTWMASMDLDVEDAQMVFQLVDADGDGRLTAQELISGVARLMGDARNLDLLILMREQKEVMRLIEDSVIPQLDRVIGSSAKRGAGASSQNTRWHGGIGGRFLNSKRT